MERPGGDSGPEMEVAPPAEVGRFVLPVMAGSVQQLAPLELAAPAATYAGSLTLIARRSAARGGTRLWRRGADKQVPRRCPLRCGACAPCWVRADRAVLSLPLPLLCL